MRVCGACVSASCPVLPYPIPLRPHSAPFFPLLGPKEPHIGNRAKYWPCLHITLNPNCGFVWMSKCAGTQWENCGSIIPLFSAAVLLGGGQWWFGLALCLNLGLWFDLVPVNMAPGGAGYEWSSQYFLSVHLHAYSKYVIPKEYSRYLNYITRFERISRNTLLSVPRKCGQLIWKLLRFLQASRFAQSCYFTHWQPLYKRKRNWDVCLGYAAYSEMVSGSTLCHLFFATLPSRLVDWSLPSCLRFGTDLRSACCWLLLCLSFLYRTGQCMSSSWLGFYGKYIMCKIIFT